MIQQPGLEEGLGVGGEVGQTRETETLSKGYGLPGQRLGHGCDGMSCFVVGSLGKGLDPCVWHVHLVCHVPCIVACFCKFVNSLVC